MLYADENVAEEDPHSGLGQEFSFLLQTYYQLTGSIALVAESLKRACGETTAGAWAIYSRLNQLLDAHRSLHVWLAEIAARPPSLTPAAEVYDLCGKIAAAVLRSPNLSCHIVVDQGLMPGRVLQQFALLLYEVSQALSLDAVHDQASPICLNCHLHCDADGWGCTIILRDDVRTQARPAMFSTICRAADRIGAGVSANQLAGWCSLRLTFGRNATTEAYEKGN